MFPDALLERVVDLRPVRPPPLPGTPKEHFSVVGQNGGTQRKRGLAAPSSFAPKSLFCLARPERFELPTTWFVARYSIQLSYGRLVV